jgi:hypothetical protein
VCQLRRAADPVGAREVVAIKMTAGEPRRPATRGEAASMGDERERAYDGVHHHPPQNLDAGYRSRWAVNAVGLPPRETRRDRASAKREERTIDLTPLMRLAQEACWNRLLNPPRRPRPAEL